MIVDEAVDAAEMFHRRFDHRIALVGLTHIDGGKFAGAAVLADVIAYLGEIFHVAARDQHLRAARGEFLGDRFADAGSTASYDRHLAVHAEYVFGVCHDELSSQIIADRDAPPAGASLVINCDD